MSTTRTRLRGTTALLIAAAAALAAPVAVLGAETDDELIAVIEQAAPSVVTIGVPDGGGSGVIVDAGGLIITNGHVVGDAQDVEIILDDGTVLAGTVTGLDTLTDLALVDVEASDLPALTLGESSELKVGQLVIAMGNPLGEFPTSATVGIVSGLERSITIGDDFDSRRLEHLIQTDAAIEPGSSGGALLDREGTLIGIVTAAGGVTGDIGLALPIDVAVPIIEQALAGEPLARPYLGVRFRAIDARLAADEGLAVTAGAWVTAGRDSGSDPVLADGPAGVAGIRDGDIITAVDGVPVDRDDPLDLQLLRFKPHEEVTLSVLRDGLVLELAITLGTRPADIGR